MKKKKKNLKKNEKEEVEFKNIYILIKIFLDS